MRLYVFITTSLSNMGGAQMYMRNKLLYLRNNGWSSTIVSGQGQNITIPELKEFRCFYPELGFPIHYFSHRRQEKVLKAIVEGLLPGKYDEIVVESSSITTSTWAEEIARRIGARHLAFILQEQNRVSNIHLQQFFKFKHQRKELTGIAPNSLYDMFLPFSPISKDESYWLSASCSNVEADIDHPLLHKIDSSKYDAVVGLFSRLEKPFVEPTLQQFCKFALTKPSMKFLLLCIGNAPRGSNVVKRITDIVSTSSNVELLITGYLYPVPTKLLEVCDVILSSAGSCECSKRSGVPTISIDANDFMPIGILGKTTNRLTFRTDSEQPVELGLLLTQILIEKCYSKVEPSYQSGMPDFKAHIDFLSKANPEINYYDIYSIKPEDFTEKRIAMLLSLIGPRMYLNLSKRL